MNKNNHIVITLPDYDYFGYFELTYALELYYRILTGQLSGLVPIDAEVMLHRERKNDVDNCLRSVELMLRSGGGYYGIHSDGINDSARTVYDFDKVIRHEQSNLICKNDQIARLEYGMDAFPPYLADKKNILPVFVDSLLKNNGMDGHVRVSMRTLQGIITALESYIEIRSGNSDRVIDMFVNGTTKGEILSDVVISQAKECLAAQKLAFGANEKLLQDASMYLNTLRRLAETAA